MYIITDDTGRVCVSSPKNCLPGAVEVERPEGFDEISQHDWRLENGALVNEPEETPEQKPSTEERVAQLEAQNETLLECLLEMSEIVYA